MLGTYVVFLCDATHVLALNAARHGVYSMSQTNEMIGHLELTEQWSPILCPSSMTGSAKYSFIAETLKRSSLNFGDQAVLKEYATQVN